MDTHEAKETSLLDRTPELAWWGGWLSLGVGVLHSLARFATDAGQQDVTELTRVWADPARRLLDPLLSFADVDHVYVVYGMLWGPLFLVALGCAIVAARVRRGIARAGERWAWRVYLAGFGLATVGVVAAYYGAWINPALVDGAFVALVVPGVLVTLMGGTWLGVVLLRRRYRPRITALLLALTVPLVMAISSVMSLGSAFIPMLLAWGFTGRALNAALDRSDEPAFTGALP
jgi:hypothetical protein